MSKRNATSTPATRGKKSKLSSSQFQLDHFFSSTKSSATSEANLSASPQFVQGSSNKDIPSRKAVFANETIIDVDAFDLDDPATSSLQPVISTGPKSNASKRQSQSLFESRIEIREWKTNSIGDVKKDTSTPNVKCRNGQRHIDPNEFLPIDVEPIDYSADQQPSDSLDAPYSLLVHAFISLSETRSRIAIINILTNVLRTLIVKHPTSLLPGVYLLSNSLGPPFVALELGLGSSVISKSLKQISGLSGTALKKLYNTSGDPGDVAYAAKSKIRTLVPHPPLSVPYVHQSMLKICLCKGPGAAKDKQKIVEKLLLSAIGEEVRYLTRTLCQNLRVGAVRTSILTALARAFALTPSPASIKGPISDTDAIDSLHVPPTLIAELRSSAVSKGKKWLSSQERLSMMFKRAENLIKQVYVKHPSYDRIIPALLQNGLDTLPEAVPMSVAGVPLLPMLGSPTRSLDEIYEKLGNLPFSAEFKYDGQRAQIHASTKHTNDYEIKIFSRHMEDMTSKYPDILQLIRDMFKQHANLSSFIMDAEVVAIDPNSGELKSFQELAGRARKDVQLKDVRIAVCIFSFDLMFLNGKSLLGHSFRERRKILQDNFSTRRKLGPSPMVAQFDFVKNCESEEGRESIEEFMLSAIENRCEGLMIKILEKPTVTEPAKEKQSKHMTLLSTYEPDVRTLGWLKLKKDYIKGIGDSLDLIPVGAWHGNGRKARWWSPVLLALWNPETGRPVAMCKCMSGFTDAFYTTMMQNYAPKSVSCSTQPQWECDFGAFKPDVYFKPHEVWEIRGAE
uniref:DNA ligase n=1 Tax=Psilocybe cubensis TaxID=181762 RepID=A0A8H7Y748_PSICU